MSQRQFSQFTATSLHCPQCGQAMPVVEKLLLVLPEKELYEYHCKVCTATVGTREVLAVEQVMRREAAQNLRGPQVRIL